MESIVSKSNQKYIFYFDIYVNIEVKFILINV